ncbi:uncharacterized protein LOC123508048 isoform X2 [Portunus trituberculatus]|uniref:uncharacterized protein LOC123508048 isoform X2 n=1 Tax=Portunus trituberculatus TaxID=210409 RepID=UPI001E1CB016|nr:uncharacterized protein LOC123508048 isoform X2 [Portunus trituberculatus]
MRLSLLLVFLLGVVGVSFAKKMPPKNDITNKESGDFLLCCYCDCETFKGDPPNFDPKNPFKDGGCTKLCKNYCPDVAPNKQKPRGLENFNRIPFDACCACNCNDYKAKQNSRDVYVIDSGICQRTCKFFCSFYIL